MLDQTANSMAEVLRAMVLNERPELDASPAKERTHGVEQYTAQERVFDQLQQMYEDQTITSRPGSYYSKPGALDPYAFPIHPEKGKPHEVKNPYHPISQRLSRSIQRIRETAAPGAYICGADLNRRYKLSDTPGTVAEIPPLPPKADAYAVPAYGDVVVAYEMMRLIEARLKGEDPNPEAPIIIDNRGDFWKHLLAPYEQSYNMLNIHAFGGQNQPVWKEAELLLGKMRGNGKEYFKKPVTIPPDSLILVGTKTNEKIIELQQLFKGTGVRVMRLDHFANFQDPTEVSGTYAGNAMEKIGNAQKALRERAMQAPDLLRNNILKNCPDPKNPSVYILSEDSGIHLVDQRISKIMQQEGTLRGKVKDSLVLHHDQFPGVEFGPAVNGALGEDGFWNTVNAVIKKHENDTNPETRTLNPGVVNASVIALSKFDINEPQKKQPVDMFAGVNNSTLEKRPAVEKGEIPNTSHYLVPDSQSVNIEYDKHGARISNYRLTQAQLGPEYLGHHSARTFATRALRQQMGLPEGMDRPMPAHPLHIGISDPKTADEFSNRYVQQESTLQHIAFSGDGWPAQAEALCAKPDVYYLTEREDSSEKALFEDVFRFCSLIVSKQLVPRDKDKLMAVHAEDESWKPFLDLYDHLRHIGMANDQQNTFIRRVKSTDHLDELLERTAQNKFDGEYFTNRHFDDKDKAKLSVQPADKFNVAMFCSATSKNQNFNDEASAFGKYLAEHGHGMVFGAADKEMMGAARLGFIAGKKAGSKNLLIGSSTDDILPIESEHPQAVIDSLDVYHHASHIYDRMQFMMRQSDAFAIYPGGAGTVQELMLLVCARAAHNKDMGDKPIFLFNKPLEIGAEQIGFYDPLIKMIGRETLERYGVQICESEQCMYELIESAKAQRTNGRAI